jgi:uncharacterized protein YndB with AHSA1/START domain
MSERLRGYAHRVDIVGEVSAVWRAFTEAPHLPRWCAPDATLRARPGGLFRASVDRVTQLEASVDVCEPNRRLRLIYLPSPALPATETAIVADFILEPSPPPERGVILRVLGSGIPDGPGWDTQYKRMRVGWSSALTRLKVYVEKQMDRPVPPAGNLTGSGAGSGTGPGAGSGAGGRAGAPK